MVLLWLRIYKGDLIVRIADKVMSGNWTELIVEVALFHRS